MSLKRTYVEENLYIESRQEIKRLKLDLQELDEKLNKEKKSYQRKEETYQRIISNLQKELETKNASIIELVEHYLYFNEHFGKSFEICQSLYELEVLNKVNKSVSTDLEVYQQEEVQEKEVEKETDDELDYDPDEEWLKYLKDDI
ncbi:30126_t:CDS:2 [Racocetra persica]|uniref:30126_t:CDS:1 n=1 Tax=Racocetra persica TaxID=160502 RepID=A0ACA9SIV1_9GLOM|nr:30126_t:CDS:2 [Racocetra persica]